MRPGVECCIWIDANVSLSGGFFRGLSAGSCTLVISSMHVEGRKHVGGDEHQNVKLWKHATGREVWRKHETTLATS